MTSMRHIIDLGFIPPEPKPDRLIEACHVALCAVAAAAMVLGIFGLCFVVQVWR